MTTPIVRELRKSDRHRRVAALIAAAVCVGCAAPAAQDSQAPTDAAAARPSSVRPSAGDTPTSASPDASPAEPPTWVPDQPPAVTINGVAGEPFSWCYGNACMDGAPWLAPLDILPAVAATVPLIVLPEEAAVVEGGYVLGERGGDGEIPSSPVSVENGSIEAVPAGDWTRIVVAVRFSAGGSATYLWRLGE